MFNDYLIQMCVILELRDFDQNQSKTERKAKQEQWIDWIKMIRRRRVLRRTNL